MPGEADAGGTMDVDAKIVLVGEDRMPGMHPHANPELRVFGPGVLGHRALGNHGRLGRRTRIVEGDEEFVASAVDLRPVGVVDRSADEMPVLDQHAVPLVFEPVRQLRRPLEVCEEEGNRPGRKLGHQARAARVEIAWSLFMASSAATL